MIDTEKISLERISQKSLYAAGANEVSIKYSFRIASRFFVGNSILELGPAEGVMTELLATTGKTITVVEGAAFFCEKLRQHFPQLQIVNALFEEFDSEGKQFDNIILGHVLEHVIDPVDILCRVRSWLAPHGRVFAAVPNARSLHRQAAVIMGLLPGEDSLNDMDRHHGHRRVFNPESFRSIFIKAGLRIEILGGYWLKPLSNRQIEQHWTPEMLDAFMELGEQYPDISGEIYIVASSPEDLKAGEINRIVEKRIP